MTNPPLLENVQQQKALSELSTFGIGGPADYFIAVKDPEQLAEALRFAHAKRIPWWVMGKGSNSLFDDAGFRGLVILNKMEGIEDCGEGRILVGAGHSFAHLGVWTARKGWGGLEFASGIPGSVGGAVFMNAGANGSETCEALESVEFVHRDGTRQHFSRKELSFSYRWSSFHELPGVIAQCSFQLHVAEDARQRQLEIVAYRTSTQPYGEPSAGCIFRNPQGGGAGALIDELGLKGLSHGGAAVSELHANFIVNKGGATAQDVLALAREVENRVKEATGIELEREVRFVPADGGMHA